MRGSITGGRSSCPRVTSSARTAAAFAATPAVTLILDVRSGDRASAGAPHAGVDGSHRRPPPTSAACWPPIWSRSSTWPPIPRCWTAAAGGRWSPRSRARSPDTGSAGWRPAPTASADAATGGRRRPGSWSTSMDRPAYLRGGASGSGGTSRPVTSTRSTSAGCCARRSLPTPTRGRWRIGWPSAIPAPYQGVLDLGGLDRHRLARAVPAPGRRSGSRPVPDQGHHAARRTVRGQGLSREHHDHRPGPQRPRAGSAGPGSVVVTALLERQEHPGPGAPGVHGHGPARRRRRLGARSWPPRSRPGRSPARRRSARCR